MLFRSLALQALVGNSSGTSAPAVTFPYQWWADGSAGVLRMRNAANTAWISVGLLGVANMGHILPGAVVVHAKSAVPPGYLTCNGGAVSRTTYSDLFSEISTTFGAGDGSTTFNVPDLRGEFLRGWDDGRGVDTGRGFGSWQNGAIEAHTHGYDRIDAGSGDTRTNIGAGTAWWVRNNTATAITGGSETRPRNVALLPCIKY